MRLHDVLEYRARQRPDALFAVHDERQITYHEALTEVNRLANGFVRAGLEIGDRVAVLTKNCIEQALVYFGSSKAGVAPVMLNYRLAPSAWTRMINDAQAKMLIAAGKYLEPLEKPEEEIKTVEQLIDIDPPARSGWKHYRQWVADQPAAAPDRHIKETDDACQLYTSGTTGRPKGVVLTHASITAATLQSAMALQVEQGARHLMVLPMYHIFGTAWVILCVYWGGCMVIHDDFNPLEVLRALSERRIGYAPLVPSMIHACLLATSDVPESGYDHLRMIIYGGSPIAERTLRRANGVFRCQFAQVYGMTEAAPLSYLLPADHQRALTDKPELLLSAGRPVVGVELRIVDAGDSPVPNGAVGEIIARGPQLMRGYWNRPEESAMALRGGWMHTGDAGALDDEGYLYIRDRVKEMIVSGGEKIYPRMVEDVLHQHPSVADAAVIGVPDEKWGEAVKAVVVLHPGVSATEDEIIDFCRERLGGFERPRSVDFVDALPRNLTGKVLKDQLREPYWEGHRRRVGGA